MIVDIDALIVELIEAGRRAAEDEPRMLIRPFNDIGSKVIK
jgi:hypothetical protein